MLSWSKRHGKEFGLELPKGAFVVVLHVGAQRDVVELGWTFAQEVHADMKRGLAFDAVEMLPADSESVGEV